MTVANGFERIAASWPGVPLRTGAPPPFPAHRAYRAVRRASAPFHAGTRFRTLPDVRFHTAAGRLRAPADRLPTVDDNDLTQYQDRVAGLLSGTGYQLLVEQPLVLDVELWSAMRDAITPLWQRVGWPSLPLITELVIADSFTDAEAVTRAPSYAELTWVLHGEMRARLLPPEAPVPAALTRHTTAAMEVLAGRPGDLLYWPAGYRSLIDYGSRAVVLRLRIPGDSRLAVGFAHDLLAEVIRGQGGHGGPVPYLPFPPESGVAVPLAAVGTAISQALAGPWLSAALGRHWAKCRSAAGLLPPPPPRSWPEPDAADRLVVTADIVALPSGPDRWVCGVNGFALDLRGSAGRRMLAALRPGRTTTLAELCGEVRARGDAAYQTVRALVAKLHTVRGVEVMAPDDREVTPLCR